MAVLPLYYCCTTFESKVKPTHDNAKTIQNKTFTLMFEQMLVHWIKDQTESDGVNFRRPWFCNSFNTSICVDLISNTLPFCREEYIEPIISKLKRKLTNKMLFSMFCCVLAFTHMDNRPLSDSKQCK